MTMEEVRASARGRALEDLCQRYHVDIVWSFGSRAMEVRDWLAGVRDGMSPGPADADIGVKVSPDHKLSVTDKVRLTMALEEIVSVPRVDLVLLRDADPFLAANIIRGERLLARDSYLADEYELYILRRAGDLAPLERERLALIFGKTD